MIEGLHPTVDAVKEYLNRWDSLENYVLQEKSLDKLFFDTYPHNTDISDILVKASTLNDFYSTNIFSIFPVAKHILELDIDERLQAGDEGLVNDIALVDMGGGKRNFYSFATKYCSHHFPLLYPIYDSYVDKVLMEFKKRDHFSKFIKSDLKDYGKFKSIVIAFRDYYGLNEFSLKDVDRYLWQLGKEKFPLKY
ncbi:MAG: hypothetical protein ACOX8S_13010 [Christensenellales bacterium]|jgi:hypothetical protein|nr:hypothetical protein [Candidatus Saccharibacteria bacterium]